MSEWDQVTELNQLELFLRQPDAVMEPNIMEKLRQYVAKGGSPRDVVEMLTDSYVGYAQMANLVVDWMHDLENPEASPQQEQPSVDEAYFLRELAKQKFDSNKFAGVFTRGGGGPPKWLDGLAADRQGRQLIYDLSAKHHNCLLLNYAIQKILRQGHEDEVASIGSRLASYFGVFHRLLINRLREVPTASVQRLRQLSIELKETCCQGHHTYLYAQLLLTHLGRLPKGVRFTRLSQELEQYAASKRGPVVWRMMPLFLPAELLHGNEECAELVTKLLCIAPSSGLHAGLLPLVSSLENLCFKEDPPPAQIVRHPRVCEILTTALFSPESTLTEEAQHTISRLLAFATSAEDSRPGGAIRLDNVQPVTDALRQGTKLMESAASGEKLSPADRETAERVFVWPVVAQGVLCAMRGRLTSVDYWLSTDRGSAASSFLQLLAIIIPKHQAFHSQVVDVIGGALKTMGNARPEVARSFIEMAVVLLQVGQVLRVMKFAERWAATADPSLVRHFIFTLLEACSPPYSSDFAASLIRLMQHAGVKWSRQQQRTLQDIERLEEFAAACKDIHFSPPLGAKETKYLEDLQSERNF